jgi:hypothetical protein
MLSEFQINRVWENMLAAETRSLYFGDLASRYTRKKQWITGLSFFLSFGAAASFIGKAFFRAKRNRRKSPWPMRRTIRNYWASSKSAYLACTI